MAAVPQLPLVPEVLQELTARLARSGVATQPGDNEAAQYLLFLRACQAVLDHAPHTVEDCGEEQIAVLLVDGMSAMLDTITGLLPGGPDELISYISDQATWGSNYRRYG